MSQQIIKIYKQGSECLQSFLLLTLNGLLLLFFFLVPSMSHCCYKAGRQDLQEGKIAMMVDS